MKPTILTLIFGLLLNTSVAQPKSGTGVAKTKTYASLETLCKDLRSLERTNLPSGVPDYRIQTIQKIQKTLLQYKTRHDNIDTVGWPIAQKIDYVLLRAEMNALDYNCRILKPWVRDPAFYAIVWNEQSDTPDHEGPTSFAAIELWKYAFPLSPEAETALTAQLKIIPPLYEQAKGNLTGNAKDLWSAGIGVITDQLPMLEALEKQTANNGAPLKNAIAEAKTAISKLALWLEKELPKKNGPSGIGKDNYNWHLRHVMMVPFSWDEEVALLGRELTRAFSALQLERERNRNLPELKPFSNEQEFAKGTDLAVNKIMAFLKKQNILPVKAYMEPELRKHIGAFIPEDKRNFFGNISHRAPEVLYAHLTHWFEIARFREEPHPSIIRREPLPYNLWMQRSEGLATGLEETFMHAGLWDDNPRARELVWIMLAQRCARGLASLYAQANMINYEQARKYQVEWTPKGWTGDESLVGFEQHLYLRQPGYGTSYVTGKYFMEKLIMDMGRLLQNDFTLYQFFEKFYDAGVIPLTLVNWQMTASAKQRITQSGKSVPAQYGAFDDWSTSAQPGLREELKQTTTLSKTAKLTMQQTQNGKWVIVDNKKTPLYDVFIYDNGPDYPTEGLIRVVKNGKIGYADAKTYALVIEPQFDCAFPFENGKAKVSNQCKTIKEGEHSRWESDRWQYVDKQGRF